MDKQILLKNLNAQTELVWSGLCNMYSGLNTFPMPRIKLCGRLWRCAGNCAQEHNIITLGYKFFNHSKKYYNIMYNVILPHEIIHQADYNLFGESELKCGHGLQWQLMMIKYGLKPEPYHSMMIERK
jgi:predicted SprT family Zn-dependent metalloprotease